MTERASCTLRTSPAPSLTDTVCVLLVGLLGKLRVVLYVLVPALGRGLPRWVTAAVVALPGRRVPPPPPSSPLGCPSLLPETVEINAKAADQGCAC